jgi:acyl-CoA dehydrogenase
MSTFSPATETIRHEVREWALEKVRPRARQADLAHAPPPDHAAVLATCPVSFRTETDPRAADAVKADGAGVVASLVMEETSFGDVWPMFSPSAGGGIGAAVVGVMGTPEQKERWLAPVRRGEIGYTAFALTEPHFGSDPSQVATTARREGDHWVLNGTKMYCSMGASAEYAVVFATVDEQAGRAGIRAFVVERNTPGVKVTKPNEDKLGIRAAETSELRFENCAVPLDHRLGFSGDAPAAAAEAGGERGWAGALGAMASSRPQLAGVAIGIARASRQVASDWARERRAEFTPARWDRIQDDFARMQDALDQARRLVVRALWEKDRLGSNRRSSSAAKAFAPPIAERVIRRCVQIMGADGVSQDHLVEKWYRDIKIFDIFEGSGQIHRITIARELMGSTAARG